MIADRTKLINDRLEFHFGDIGCEMRSLSKFEWATAQFEDPSNLHRPYGWVPPFLCEPSEEYVLVAAWCPTLIAEQTADLGDEDFESYLCAIEFVTAMHVTHRELPWQERERLIEGRIWEEGEDSLRLLSHVQMQLFDKLADS